MTNQNFEKVRCETPNMPRIFMGGKITEPVQVELVPVAEITYQNNVKIYADDIILSDSDEVVL